MHRTIALWASTVALVACAEAPPSRTKSDPLLSTQPVYGAVSRLAGAPPGVTTPGYVFPGGIRAILTPAPFHADPERVLELLDPVGDLPAGTEVMDVAPVAGGWLVLRPGHVLTFWNREGGSRVLADRVYPPLSVRGSFVAFAHGSEHWWEIGLYDLSRDQLVLSTDGVAPAWNPAVDETGRVVFVSGATTEPVLMAVSAGSAPVPLARGVAFPSWYEAPINDGDHLVFRDEAGTEHRLALRPAAELAETEDSGVLR